VFSKGGFVSIPLSIAAWIMRKKIYIHESDIQTGLANKIIGKLATKVFYTFPIKNKNTQPLHHIHTGQILNSQLLESIQNIKITPNARLKILVIA
jgi:UDP-N-acetylglucosamine--N-acetylmuramyl-(pentapeptide) pyrophosphoryl-undecaprenol N-acetylglucosamine transferase